MDLTTEVKRAVVSVEVVEDAKSAVVQGATGYLVAPHLAVTCARVVQDLGELNLWVGHLGGDPDRRCPAQVLAIDEENDIAVLALMTPVEDVRPLLLNPRERKDRRWLAYGFPRSVEAGLWFEGEVADWDARDAGRRPALQLRSSAGVSGLGGLSGAPVIVEGTVVGHLRTALHVEGDRTALGILFATPARFIDELLLPDAGPDTRAAPPPAVPATSRRMRPVQIFLSSADEDDDFADMLVKHLAPMKSKGEIRTSGMSDAQHGVDTEAWIHEQVRQADLFIPLLSADYLASREKEREVQMMVQRASSDGVPVIPVLVRPCDWHASPLAKFQVLPDADRPVSTWSNRDEAFVSIVRNLRKVVIDLSSPVGPAPPPPGPSTKRAEQKPDGTAPPQPPAIPPPDPARRLGGKRGAINDRNYEKDQLGFSTYVMAFADLIESRSTSPPLTIGIFGSWGMGKSFLLSSIVAELEKRRKDRASKKDSAARPADPSAAPVERVHVVTFNAWEYSVSRDVWPRLVRRILDELEASKAWSFGDRVRLRFRIVRYHLRKVWRRAPWALVWLLGLGLVGFSAYRVVEHFNLLHRDLTDIENAWKAVVALATTGILGTLVKAVADSVKKPLGAQVTGLFAGSSYGAAAENMKAIRADLDLLGHRVSKDTDRILILIDDLDRCEPRKSVEVLKAINLLLNFDNFIVCLGIDARVTTRAIEDAYKNLLGPAGASGYEYLDKIVQIPFSIPTPGTAEIELFLRQIMDVPERSPASPDKVARRGVEENDRAPTSTGEAGRPPAKDAHRTRSPATPDERAKSATAPAKDAGGAPKSAPGGAVPVHRPVVDVAFTEDELHAFEEIARYLRPNPRHLKRLVNVYRLVRILAEYRYAADIEKSKNPGVAPPIVLRRPAAAIGWLAACGQWPYTVHLMMEQLDELHEARDARRIAAFPGEPPLIWLLDRAAPFVVGTMQHKLDHDADMLRLLLEQCQSSLTWDDVDQLRQYTVNFNPAIESEPQARPESSKAATPI